jgi:hypothetical protein
MSAVREAVTLTDLFGVPSSSRAGLCFLLGTRSIFCYRVQTYAVALWCTGTEGIWWGGLMPVIGAFYCFYYLPGKGQL